MKYFIIIFGIISNALASVLIKYATMAPRSFPSLNEPLQALRNWPFWMGIFFYGLAFIFYGMSLARFPLNVAHPLLTAGAITVVSLFSLLVFKEPFNWSTVLGIIFILIGVVFVTSK
jgi:small multidrug resistance pump